MQRHEQKSGKTLIRALFLLVVVAILIELLFPCPCAPKEPARRLQARSSTEEIIHALRSYRAEYGHYPEIGKPGADGVRLICVGDFACKACTESNGQLFDVLRAIPRRANANHVLNPRQIKFIQERKARDRKNPHDGLAEGPEFSDLTQGCFFDPWGQQYCIIFSADGSDKLDVSGVYSDLSGPERLVPNPSAFSLGKDGIPGGKGYEGKLRRPGSDEAPDDIVSWQ